ncbi:hypothetical protein BOTNAR_0221g00170 [Botryotinia narcissicola]|uniref:Uncharacterized protein n=1 Tax=Botryotinia narcissicola TaxID=278944 RepID=A0A4Z1IIK0_9HELO|nr:hypothetical protein BOTNAR_0221g00170 [Botryotinia narcissicola]
MIIDLVSESEDTEIEESQSEEYGSKDEERGKESAGSNLVGAKRTRKIPNIARNWSQAHSPQGSGKTADGQEKEKDCSVSIRKYTSKTKSLSLNKDIPEENKGDTTAFRDEKNQQSEEDDERKEEKGVCFPLSKYTGNSLNLPIAKGTAPGPKHGRDLVLELHRLEERTISTSKIQNKHLIAQIIIAIKENVISSSIPALKIKSISHDEDIMILGVKRRKKGMPRIPEDEEDSESEEGESAIITAQPHSTPSKNTSPAHASMALEHKRKLNTMPSTAQEQESKGQPDYFSNPSPPLLDGSRFKRQKTAPVNSWVEVNKDIDGVLRVESISRLIPESVTDHLLPREIIRAKSPKSFADLPGLVIRQILDTVCEQEDGKLISSICFGLTCKLHWAFFKARWCPPGSDMIYEGYLPKEDQALLAPFLQSWVPERYRMMSGKGGKGGPSLVPMFLSKNQYEEGYTREEERLEKRYVACLSILDATNLDGMQLKSSRGLHAIIDNTIDLPSPYGMGHSWYDASASEYLFLVEKWEYSTLNGDGPGFKAICESWYTFQDTCLWDWVNGENFNQFREDWMDDEGMKGRQKVKQTLLKFDKKVKKNLCK